MCGEASGQPFRSSVPRHFPSFPLLRTKEHSDEEWSVIWRVRAAVVDDVKTGIRLEASRRTPVVHPRWQTVGIWDAYAEDGITTGVCTPVEMLTEGGVVAGGRSVTSHPPPTRQRSPQILRRQRSVTMVAFPK